jgi:hypothetical protein
MNLGGINVVVPSSPADAKGLLKAAIRCDNPTFFLQAGGRGGEQGEVPEEEYVTPLGKADVKRIGTDATIVAIGAMVRPALRAAQSLQQESGLSVEVIDPRTLVPLDEATILESVAKTGRLVVADEARDRAAPQPLPRWSATRVSHHWYLGKARDSSDVAMPRLRSRKRSSRCAADRGRGATGAVPADPEWYEGRLKLSVGMSMEEATITKWSGPGRFSRAKRCTTSKPEGYDGVEAPATESCSSRRSRRQRRWDRSYARYQA